FDSQTFDPARLRLHYRNGRLSGEGEIGIGAGKVRGVRHASLRALYDDGRLEAHGTADFTIPGIERATLDLVRSETETSIEGTLALGRLPGIRSGSLQGRIAKGASDPNWRLSARGTAIPNIPAVDTTVTVVYDNGAFTAEGTAAYRRGMLDGSLTIGVTNRAVNAAGQPEGDPTDHTTVYGGGMVTIRLTPWLQGRLGLRLLPNGEIEATGGVELPAALDIFDEKSYSRSIF